MKNPFSLGTIGSTFSNKKQPKSLSFNFSTGEFDIDSKGGVVITTPEDSVVLWVRKTLYHLRFSKIGYTGNYGIETDVLNLYNSREAKESWLKRTITEAIGADPHNRIADVEEFSFYYPEPDSIIVKFTIILRSGVKRVIESEIKSG